MSTVYVLLVTHFVADFLAQSDWMALNKSKSWQALAVHVWVYMAVMFGAMVVLAGTTGHPANPPLTWLAVNAVAHFVQDAITSRINSRLWFIDGARVSDQAQVDVSAYFGAIGEISSYEAMQATWDRLNEAGAQELIVNGKRHWFFVAIGFDQLLHYVTLFVTAGWWLR